MDALGTALSENIEDLVRQFSIEEPRFAMQYQNASLEKVPSNFYLDPISNTWKQVEPSAIGEANLILAGSLMYDRLLESYANVGDRFQFRHLFGGLRDVLTRADLSVGSLGVAVADMYPTVSRMTHTLSGRGHYSNARVEYLDGIRFGGFDALALANVHNLDAGARGALATEANVLARGMVPAGLGVHESPLFEVNGISIGLVSFSAAINLQSTLTDDGRTKLVREFAQERARLEIQALRERGAKFIIGYLDTQSNDRRYKLNDRERLAREFAEAGADYIVCTEPRTMSRYSKFRASDGRVVPIASSLGTVLAGIGLPYTRVSALLSVTIRQREDGAIEYEDSYIPIGRQAYDKGGLSPVAVAHQFYAHRKFDSAAGMEVQQKAEKILGSEIGLNGQRRISNVTPVRPQLTPKEISQLLSVQFSPRDLKILGDRFEKAVPVVATPDLLNEDVCAVSMTYKRGESSRNFFKGISHGQVIETSPVMAIATKSLKGVPTLIVEKPWDAYMQLIKAVRDWYNPFTVAVTGTAGKTTTKDMLGMVFPRAGQTMHITGNGNTEIRGAASIMRLSPKDRYYIQEVHGATPGSSKAHSEMVKPDVAIITSIGEGHLEQMGTIENIVQGKLEIADGLTEGGVLVLNNDNEYLKSVDPAVNVIRYGIDDESADYRAINVRTVGESMEFEVVEPGGDRHFVRLNVLGKHNVSNALATFAAARQALIPAHIIIAGLSRYRPSSIRQNVIETGGYKVFLDAFNSNVLSMTLAVETLQSLEIPRPGGRRVVVMGDMGEQGDKFVENHQLIGDRIAKCLVDQFFGIGEGVSHTADRLRNSEIPVFHTMDPEELIRALSSELRPGDVILFKASGAVNLTKLVVYPLFGVIA